MQLWQSTVWQADALPIASSTSCTSFCISVSLLRQRRREAAQSVRLLQQLTERTSRACAYSEALMHWCVMVCACAAQR